MKYKILIEAEIESNFEKNDLENKLVIALFDYKNNYTKSDGIDDELEVSEYLITKAVLIDEK